MKRKAATRPASKQPVNKMSSSKGKQVAGTPVDTDQEADEVLRANASSQKAMSPQPGRFGQHLLKGFAALWNDRSQLADVILSVGDQQILAHGCVLCVWSEVFKALLTRWSAQRTDNGAKAAAVTVDLSPGDSPEDFLELLHFCYVGTCQLKSHNVMPLLRLSNYYEILPLKEICGEFLFELLTARNCLNLLLELTEKYACSRARRMLSQQMAQNFEALLEEGALWRLPCRVWHEILMQDCLAVAHEADVLWAVRQYAQLQESDGMKESVMGRLLPCVRLPQLGLTMLLNRVEQDTWLMSLDVTKLMDTIDGRCLTGLPGCTTSIRPAVGDRLLVNEQSLAEEMHCCLDYLANAFRCLLLTKEGKSAKPLAIAASTVGPNRLHAHSRLPNLHTMGVNQRPPSPMNAGSGAGSSSSHGDHLACMRQITMDMQGRPRRPLPSFTSPHPEGHNLGFFLGHGRCVATAQAEGGLRDSPADYWENGVNPRPPRQMAPDGLSSCYTVVQPGLKSGSMYMELQIQSMRPSSRGSGGLKFWVVRSPKVAPRPPQSDVQDVCWDCYGTVYGKVTSGTASLHGQDGTVRQVAPTTSEHSDGPTLQPPTTCEGFTQGDIIGVGVRTTGLTAGGGIPLPSGHPQHQTWEPVIITFHKNGRLMAKHMVSAVNDVRSLKGTRTWHVMVSSGTPGDSVQLLRLPPTQAAKPSTACISETAQPAAQLDAKSQGQRQSAALKELMTAPVPHPQRGAHNIWHEDHVERMGGQERLARLRGILPEYAAEEPGWTDEEEDDYIYGRPLSPSDGDDEDEDGWADEVALAAEEERYAMRHGAPFHPGVPF